MQLLQIENPSTLAERARAIELAMTIDGWLTAKEAGALYDAAYNAKGPIVEIGSWQGRSTAVLALGSIAGSGQPVLAIDNFADVPEGLAGDSRESALKTGLHCSQSLLRENLDRVGVNGQVTILPVSSMEAAAGIDSCGVLFVDGDHCYKAVAADLSTYMPKLVRGGIAVIHDCHDDDPGVVAAVNEHIVANPLRYRILQRIDSAIVVTPCNTTQRKVILGFPGPSLCFGAARGLMTATLGCHDVTVVNASAAFCDDFNSVWAEALNALEKGKATHFAMLHSDIIPDPGWLDILLDELEENELDLVSAVSPIKDTRGLTSCGIGDPNESWTPFKRFTMYEVLRMPETFGIEETEYPDKFLLHNTACWTCDMRSPIFRAVDERGHLKAFFDFKRRVARNSSGRWEMGCESEDWYFSRKIHELGAKTKITRKVRLSHRGHTDFPNWLAWGQYQQGDKDTKHKWAPIPQGE